MFVFLDFILFCFEGVLEAFYSVLLLLFLKKIIGVFFL